MAPAVYQRSSLHIVCRTRARMNPCEKSLWEMSRDKKKLGLYLEQSTAGAHLVILQLVT